MTHEKPTHATGPSSKGQPTTSSPKQAISIGRPAPPPQGFEKECPERVDREAPRVASVHLVIGPVGAGKSTFAGQLALREAGVHFALDEWMTQLFAADRPETGVVEWYEARAARAVAQIWRVSQTLAARGISVVLELGLLRRDQRAEFYERVASAELPLVVHVLDAPRELRRRRVLARNHDKGPTYSMHVPEAVFELASDMWQPPDAVECRARNVRWLDTSD